MKHTIFPTAFLAFLLAASGARADILIMKDGSQVEGKIIHESDQSVTVLFVRAGNEATVTYPRARIDEIVREERTRAERVEDEYYERAGAVPAGDVQGWWKLAQWAGEQGLEAHRREALERLLAIDPEHAQAREALGFLKVDGAWLPAEEAEARLDEIRWAKAKAEREARRAEGFIEYDGAWYKPEELQALAAVKQADNLGGVIERLDAIEAKLDRRGSFDQDAINTRFDRLEDGMQKLADAMAEQFQRTRADAAAEHDRLRSRINDLFVELDQIRQEMENLRRDLGGRR